MEDWEEFFVAKSRRRAERDRRRHRTQMVERMLIGAAALVAIAGIAWWAR